MAGPVSSFENEIRSAMSDGGVRTVQYADTQPPGSPVDMTNDYNTKLTPSQEAQFQQTPGARDVYDYDSRGAFIAGDKPDPTTGHGGDRFKKPNHPTFSTQSQYHGQDGHVGGVWQQLPNGTTTFTPSPTNLQMMDRGDLQRYFELVEPNNQLILPPGN